MSQGLPGAPVCAALPRPRRDINPARCPPLPAGTKSAARLEENLGALSVQLSPAELAELETAVPQDAVVGDRYAHMAGTYHGS